MDKEEAAVRITDWNGYIRMVGPFWFQCQTELTKLPISEDGNRHSGDMLQYTVVPIQIEPKKYGSMCQLSVQLHLHLYGIMCMNMTLLLDT